MDDTGRLADRVRGAQEAANQRRLDALYVERFGTTAKAPQIHPVPGAVQRATLPESAQTKHRQKRSTTP